MPGFPRPTKPPLRSQRFPLKPLADAMGIQLLAPADPTGNQHQAVARIGTRELAARLHTPHRTVIRWRAEGIPRYGHIGGRSVDLPDHLACIYAGIHPVLVWPEWLVDPDLDDLDTEELCEGV